jgi:Icc-related predicted phosphoesterase
VSADNRNSNCFFATDLHGHVERYTRLFAAIRSERPHAVFLGGDLLPHGLGLRQVPGMRYEDFIRGYLASELERLKRDLADHSPVVFAILGNDDPRVWESDAIALDKEGLWTYVHQRRVPFDGRKVYGYAFVPPTPFRLKDWERYDVSRGVDPGSISPEDGIRSVDVPPNEIRYATIKDDLEKLTGSDDVTSSIFLFHAPPFDCGLDRVARDGMMVDHVPLDLHVGSIAIQRFIQTRQPRITLHGHIHESARLTGIWKEQFGRTWAYNGAHDGPELSLIRFDPEHPGEATRVLI